MHVHLNESTREGTNLEAVSGVVLEGSRDTDGGVKFETSQSPPGLNQSGDVCV